jgi:hypothetical protein
MQTYLMPLTNQTQTIGGQTLTVSAPKYFRSDMAGLSFSCVPFGGDGMGIVSLAKPNATLSKETDVYSFPSDLSTTLADGDVTTLSAYLTAANIPSDQISTGMTWADVLQVIAKIFLVAQQLYGVTGSGIFTNGATLTDPLSNSGVAGIAPQATNIKAGKGSSLALGACPSNAKIGFSRTKNQ